MMYASAVMRSRQLPMQKKNLPLEGSC